MSETTAASRVRTAVATLAPIGLDEMQETAALQTRIDRKYFVPLDLFDELVRAFATELRVMQIGDRRDFRYRSVYFDTQRLDFFRDHLQGRRQRYKARTRVYLDSGLCMVEVKLKGKRGETVKKRQPYNERDAARLDASAEEFVLTSIAHSQEPGTLRAVLTTNYRRVTLAHAISESRITCDVDLQCSGNGASRSGLADTVLIETKTLGGAGPIDRWLRTRSIRPHSVSKYCIGIALLYPEVKSNPWRRTLLRHFGPPASALPAAA